MCFNTLKGWYIKRNLLKIIGMKSDIFNAIKYFFYYQYKYSDASMIGQASFDKYIKILGHSRVIVSEDSNSKRIQFEDLYTLYVFKFSIDGEFQQIEREIWYEYKWPKFKKTILMSYDRE
jgi:hypothetical protein